MRSQQERSTIFTISVGTQHYVYFRYLESILSGTLSAVVKYENTSNTCVDLVLTNGVIHYGPGESLLNQNKARTTLT